MTLGGGGLDYPINESVLDNATEAAFEDATLGTSIGVSIDPNSSLRRPMTDFSHLETKKNATAKFGFYAIEARTHDSMTQGPSTRTHPLFHRTYSSVTREAGTDDRHLY